MAHYTHTLGVAYYSTIALYSFTPHTFCQDEQSEETQSRQKNRVFKLADNKMFLIRHDHLLCACNAMDCSSQRITCQSSRYHQRRNHQLKTSLQTFNGTRKWVNNFKQSWHQSTKPNGKQKWLSCACGTTELDSFHNHGRWSWMKGTFRMTAVTAWRGVQRWAAFPHRSNPHHHTHPHHKATSLWNSRSPQNHIH